MRGAQEARTPLRHEHQEGIQLSSSGGGAVDKLVGVHTSGQSIVVVIQL